MLIDIQHADHIYVVCGTTDMRKSIEGCMGIVSEVYHLDPFSSSLFLFCNKKKTTMKALHFDVNGFELLTKKLMDGKFQWPKNQEEAKSITKQELRWLLEGLSIEQKKSIQEIRKKNHLISFF